jgi:hypothetical protein
VEAHPQTIRQGTVTPGAVDAVTRRQGRGSTRLHIFPVSGEESRDFQPVPLVPGTSRTDRAVERPVGEESRRRWHTLTSIRLPTSTFDADAEVDLSRPRVRPWVWALVGVGGAVAGQAMAWWLFGQIGGGFAGALLLTICLLAGYIHPVFQRNSKEIWTGRRPPWQANGLLLRDLALLFLGLLAGFFLAVLVLGPTAYHHAFAGAGDLVDLRRVARSDFQFAALGEVLGNNLRVFSAMLLVGLLFRYVGILFLVVLNAAHWGVVLAAACANTWHVEGGVLAALLLPLVTAPHLIAEMAGFVIGAMAGVFLGRGVWRYKLGSDHFAAVATAVLQLVGLGVGLVALAAVLELVVAGTLGRWTLGGGFAVMG